METENAEIMSLMERPLWQLTAREFCEITRYAYTQGENSSPKSEKIRITGIHALAEYLGCCDSTVYMLRREGVLDEAIIAQIGKKIIFDGKKAIEVAKVYQNEQREARRNYSADKKK